MVMISIEMVLLACTVATPLTFLIAFVIDTK